MSCKYIKECPTATGWCTGQEQNFEECIPFLIISKESWEKEAKEQTAAAGELKIKLAEHLEEIRNNISELRQQAKTETSDMDIVLIQWKIEQLRKEESWLEGILFRKNQIPGMEAWKVGIMQRFERNE